MSHNGFASRYLSLALRHAWPYPRLAALWSFVLHDPGTIRDSLLSAHATKGFNDFRRAKNGQLLIWNAGVDLNHQPSNYEFVALTS